MPNATVERSSNGEIARALLETVAEKTGYPAEMLELDMRLDDDLGIDSIKRVEILSALQERFPEMPPASPEQIGTLGTLREIVVLLEDHGHDAPATPPRGTAFQAVDLPHGQDAGATSSVARILIDAVAEKTGYPAEMLELDMRLDDDLGIDSIKRVEILSAVQDRLPETRPIGPEQTGTLRTLPRDRRVPRAVPPACTGSQVACRKRPGRDDPERQRTRTPMTGIASCSAAWSPARCPLSTPSAGGRATPRGGIDRDHRRRLAAGLAPAIGAEPRADTGPG